MRDVFDGVRRVTFRLPLGIDHVHCYFLRSADGSWTLVDTGLGVDDPQAVWEPLLAELDGPVERVLVTHMHPDHIGGARQAAEVTGAPVLQGRDDHEQALRAWGPERSERRLADYLVSHGMPGADAAHYMRESAAVAARVHLPDAPLLLDPGDTVDGWTVEVLPGHSDGHVVLLRDGVLVAGDTILGGITPNVPLWPAGRPDPLGDFAASLERIAALAPRLALTGHGRELDDPAGRAREILAHHRERLDATVAALGDAPRNAYEVSLVLFRDDLPPSQRRFALVEALAHLERLVHTGRAERVEDGRYRRA